MSGVVLNVHLLTPQFLLCNNVIALSNTDNDQTKGNIESAKFDIEDETAVCDESESDVGETSFSPRSQIKRVRFAQTNQGFEGLREPKWESKRDGSQMKPEPYMATGRLDKSATPYTKSSEDIASNHPLNIMVN